MTQYALHFGIKPENKKRIKKLFPKICLIDGDGWNCWGEKPGTDVNDGDTLHVVLGPFGSEGIAEAVKDYLFDLEELGPEFLIPMGGPAQQSGIKVSITEWDDWSEFSINYPEPEVINVKVTLGVEIYLRDLAKHERIARVADVVQSTATVLGNEFEEGAVVRLREHKELTIDDLPEWFFTEEGEDC